MTSTKTNQSKAVAQKEVLEQGNDRYVSSDFDSAFHHLLIQGAGVAGAALAVVNVPKLSEMTGMKPNLVFTLAAGAVGYLVGNLASQILMIIFKDLAKPFVPNSWV